jgi:hypothetical protein
MEADADMLAAFTETRPVIDSAAARHHVVAATPARKPRTISI